MAAEQAAEPEQDDTRAGELTKADWLRLVDEALARRLEHRKKVIQALERMKKLAR